MFTKQKPKATPEAVRGHKTFSIMEGCYDKVICCERDNNDNALAAAILANGRRDNDGWPMAAMAMNGGWNQNQWMNNPLN